MLSLFFVTLFELAIHDRHGKSLSSPAFFASVAGSWLGRAGMFAAGPAPVYPVKLPR